jgi:ribosome-associated protein
VKIPGGTLKVTPGVEIPGSELELNVSRAGGPGGQNVNKVETRVQIGFRVAGSPSLSKLQQEQLLQTLRNRLDGDTTLRVTVDETRSQFSNRDIALTRLAAILSAGLKPRKKRIPTRKSASSHRRRQETKRKIGDKKKLRKPLNNNDL